MAGGEEKGSERTLVRGAILLLKPRSSLDIASADWDPHSITLQSRNNKQNTADYGKPKF
jgi:hypothetical protein